VVVIIKGNALTSMLSAPEFALLPLESVTVKASEPNSPGSVGVPEITPAGLRATPGGREPWIPDSSVQV
jgi:hypothetical protein